MSTKTVTTKPTPSQQDDYEWALRVTFDTGQSDFRYGTAIEDAQAFVQYASAYFMAEEGDIEADGAVVTARSSDLEGFDALIRWVTDNTMFESLSLYRVHENTPGHSRYTATNTSQED